MGGDIATASIAGSGQRVPVVEVFIEGKRSRDRRFVAPKTGFLRCVKDCDGDYIILPLAVNYERLPEQESLARQAAGHASSGLNVGGLVGWLKVCLLGQSGKFHCLFFRCSHRLSGSLFRVQAYGRTGVL